MSLTSEIHGIWVWTLSALGVPSDTALLREHTHANQLVFPSLANSIQVTSAGGVWTLGNFSNDLIAAGALGMYDVHHIDVLMNNNAQFEIRLYYGPTDIPCGDISCERTNATDRSAQIALVSGTIGHQPLPAGSRLRAKCADSAGGSSVNIKVHVHVY